MDVCCAHRSGFSDLMYYASITSRRDLTNNHNASKMKGMVIVGKGTSIVLNNVPGYWRLIVLRFLFLVVSLLSFFVYCHITFDPV